MIIKALGIIDILNSLIAIFAIYLPSFVFWIIVLLFMKGLVFLILGDMGSLFDIAASIIIFLAFKEIIVLTFLLKVIALLLFTKGVASML